MSKVNSREVFEREYFEDSHFSQFGGYDLLTRLNSWRTEKYRKFILRHVESGQRTLLDIGCGYGHFLNILKNDFNVHGMDISHHAIKVSKYRVKCACLQADIVENGIPYSKKFDVITAISVLEHLHDVNKALKNIHEHLNDNGLFCFEIPTISNKFSRIIYNLFFSWDPTHVTILSVEEVEKLAISNGFTKLAIYSSFFPIFTKNKKLVENFSFIFAIFRKKPK